MSIEQANAFRNFVNENKTLQEQIQAGLADGTLDPLKLAAEHGYEVTPEEVLQLKVAQGSNELELTEFELEMVAGGAALRAEASTEFGELDGGERNEAVYKAKLVPKSDDKGFRLKGG